MRHDGDQRPMTKLEEVTLFKWMNHELHLEGPPHFLAETHTAAERDAFADFDRDHLGFRLYAILPTGIKLSERNPKYSFCHTALLANAHDPATQAAIESMFFAARVIKCEPRSRIAVLRFVSPDERNAWVGLKFQLGMGTVVMQATDSLTTDIPRAGLDQEARALLYHVYARGHSALKHGTVRAMFAAAAKLAVFDAQSIESIGLADFSGHKWKIVFDQITCPSALDHVRRLEVTQGDAVCQFDIQHPRAAKHAPCGKCLSIRHVTNACKNTHVAKGLAKHTLKLELDQLPETLKLSAALSRKALSKQLRQFRQVVAPDLAARLKAEKKERHAEVERQAKRDADRAAREAAHAVRVAAAARRHAAEDLARKQVQTARRAVAAQLKHLQQLANSVNADDAAVSAAPSGQQDTPTDVPTPESTADEQAPERPESTCSADDERDETDAATPQLPVMPSTTQPDTQNQAVNGGAPLSTTIIVYSPRPITGKRQRPPTPTTSDDEASEYTKYTKANPPPFEADLSPIKVVDSLTELIAAADARAAAKQTQREDIVQPVSTQAAVESAAFSPPEPSTGIAAGSSVREQEAKPKRQLSLAAFYPPQSLAEARAQLAQEVETHKAKTVIQWAMEFPSPALDALLENLRSPRALIAWMEALQARIVAVPGTGGCLYYAVHCCRTRWKLIGKTISTRPNGPKESKHTTEGNFYKDGMCQRYLEYLEQMLSDGTITIADLNRRYFNTGPPSHQKAERQAAIEAIVAFIEVVAETCAAKGLDRCQWAGDAELFAMVWFLREPLFILTEAADETMSVRVIWIDRPYETGPERIVQFMPDAGEAYEIIRTFLRHRVLPTILVHTTFGDGHFNSCRFEEDHYTDWTADDVTGHAMRLRMDPVLTELGWYVAPLENDGIPKSLNVRTESSDSDYVPSQPELVSPASLLASPDAPLEPTAHYALLRELNPRRRRRSEMARLWEQAERLNLQAYQAWDGAQECSEVRSEPDTVNSGCQFWSSQIPKLVDLLRALPYPEVAVSLLPPALVTRLGNELNDMVDDGTVPEFIRAEDPVEARRHWVRLVALVVVVSDDDLEDLRSVKWMRCHPTETIAALHDIRLFKWTAASTLVQAALPDHSSASGQRDDEQSVRQASTPPTTRTSAQRARPRSRDGQPRPAATDVPTRPRRSRHQQQQHLQLVSQNVQGLAKSWSTILEWFDGFLGRHYDSKFDVVLLQETRATEHWAAQHSRLYSRAWGYDPDRLRAPLCFWPATSRAAGGVAILLHPQSALQQVEPWHQDAWSSHFVAVQGVYDGDRVTVICVYAPTAKTPREALFTQLARLDPPEGLVFLGGDFNCSLDPEFDRSRSSTASQPSAALAGLLEAWGLVDAVMDEMQAAATNADVARFHADYHSYVYRYRTDEIATARLDRWYVSLEHYSRTGKVITAPPVARSDHDSVTIRVHPKVSPPRSLGQRAPRLRYPLSPCAVEAIGTCSRELLATRGVQLAQLPAHDAATAWDALKCDIRRACLDARRQRLAAVTTCQRSRVKRLRRALHDARTVASNRFPARPSVEDITQQLAALALSPSSRYRSIRHSLIAAQVTRAQRTGRFRQAAHAGRVHESARAFYKRISLKLCRSAAPSLPVIQGSTVGAADRIAQDWRPITQRAPIAPDIQDRLFARLPPKAPSPGLSDLDEAFTEADVVRAIKACSRGKACGLDGLGNDWYRDHADQLAPVLAPLFTLWYQARVLPPSFAAASVYCIPKKSEPTSGLDFRPIALLNTDYKVYARILLQRVRAVVPQLVAPTQYGFVPGRQVHDPVDIWSAFQRLASTGNLPPGAVAVLLDFAKAYDTLDRRFLSLALQRHGFSTALVQAVETMHLGTTAAYVADGQISAKESVVNGIRQGCPFAPTLFILAVDVLYEMVAMDSQIPGLPLDDRTRVAIAGFADDTASYLGSASEAHALLNLLDEFAAASGLVVNVHKSLAVRIGPTAGGPVPDVAGFPLAAETQLVRYLGAQISTLPQSGRLWDLALQQLRARLYLAQDHRSASTHSGLSCGHHAQDPLRRTTCVAKCGDRRSPPAICPQLCLVGHAL